jgi:hypothetical protein
VKSVEKTWFSGAYKIISTAFRKAVEIAPVYRIPVSN